MGYTPHTFETPYGGKSIYMSLGATLTVSQDSPTDVDTNTVVLAQRFNDESKGVYSLAGLASPTELKLTVSHEIGSKLEKRHLARIDHTKADSITGDLRTFSVYVVLVDPAGTAFSNAEKLIDSFRLIDFLIEGGSGANLTALLNSET